MNTMIFLLSLAFVLGVGFTVVIGFLLRVLGDFMRGEVAGSGEQYRNTQILESLFELEHEQWMEFSKRLADTEKLSPARIERWKKYWVPYSELTEEVKEQDRVWARKAMARMEILGEK